MTKRFPNNLYKFIKNFRNVKVLVVGDVMLDRYFWGDVSRISPEAPVPIVNVKRANSVLGGAANVAANIAGLGAKSILVGVCGEDSEADALSSLLEISKIQNHLLRSKERHTTVKTRIVAHNQHVARIDRETSDFISDENADMMFEQISGYIDEISIVVISDYAKGFLTNNLLERLITTCRKKNVKVIVDPKGKNYEKYKGASVLTPNRKEAAEAAKLDEFETDLIQKAGSIILRETETEAVLITQGEKGMTLLQNDGKSFYLQALARKVYDVTGAGDTVISSFAVSLGAGASFFEAAKIANIAAGLVVGEVGTTAVSIDTLQRALENYKTA